MARTDARARQRGHSGEAQWPSIGECLYQAVKQPGESASGIARPGQTLRIVNLEGQQVADLCSFSIVDPSVGMDGPYTQMFAHSWRVGVRGRILSRLCKPFWTITEDLCGEHYTGGGLFRGVANTALASGEFGIKPDPKGRGNRDIIENMMGRYGMDPLCLDPTNCFNAFMKVVYNAEGTFEVQRSPAKAGGHIDFRAEDTVLWFCAVNPYFGAINGDRPTPLEFRLYNCAAEEQSQ